jgi:hypothetical protein
MARRASKSKRSPGIGSASWLALVAATSLGVAEAAAVRAEVSVPRASLAAGRYRLVVQSYDALAATQAIPASARPRGSAQRAVTRDDLAQGIRVDFIELGERAPPADGRGVVIAWLELGEPDLEFDGRRARPPAGSVYGIAASNRSQPVKIILDQRASGGGGRKV